MHVFWWQLCTLTRVLYKYICTCTSYFCKGPACNPYEWYLFIQHTVMENITGDSGVNFCKTLKVFHNFHQNFNDDWIPSVCACTSDRERSTGMSFTRMNNLYWDVHWYSCQCKCSLTHENWLVTHKPSVCVCVFVIRNWNFHWKCIL